jgi:hypothetical protein
MRLAFSDGSQTRLLANAHRQAHPGVFGGVGQRKLANNRPAKVLPMSLPVPVEAQNYRALDPEGCLLFKSSEAIRQKSHLL